jgi:hypothetical protein
MTCRNCQFLDVPLNAAGKRIAIKTKSYRCMVVMEQPKFPESITRHYSFRWPPMRSMMEPNDGAECPTWQKISEGKPSL